MKELEEAIKHILQENSVVIFKTEKENVKALNGVLQHLGKTFSRYNITAIACSKDIDIVVVPGGITATEKET